MKGLFFLPIMLLVLVSWPVSAVEIDEQAVVYEGDNGDVRVEEILLYLEEAKGAKGALEVVSPSVVEQVAESIIVLKYLAAQAEKEGVLSDQTKAWLQWSAVARAASIELTRINVQKDLAATDWDALAYERYLAKSDVYKTEESVTLRTFLLNLEDRSEEQAVELARELAPAGMTEKQFEAVVRDVSDDKAGRETGGLMVRVRRGQTVPPFEEAAFQLTEVGQISEPIVTRYGVHVIQLIERFEARQLSFDEVKQQIISQLKKEYEAKYRNAFVADARAKALSNAVVNSEVLTALQSVAGTAMPRPPTPEEP